MDTLWGIRKSGRLLLWAWSLAAVFLSMGCAEGLPGISSGAFVPNDNPHVEDASVIGEKMRKAEFLGRFSQKQDFLFVIDDSGSMGDEIQTVRNNLNDFFATLNSRRQVDYQVALTTTDEPNRRGNLVTSDSGKDVLKVDTPNVLSEFAEILDNVGTDGSGYEMGYRAAELAIEKHGSKFMRNGVPLGVVIVSDATDKSCRRKSKWDSCVATSAEEQARYFRELRNHNGVSTKALLFPIAAKQYFECSNQLEHPPEENWEANGMRYWDVQQLMGSGFYGSICGELLRLSLWEIARRLSNRGICYDLPGTPTGNHMNVYLDGSEVSLDEETGYHFENGTGSVCFAGALTPAQGQKIVVTYEDSSL